jgi:pimeloyl-ACP methyl ester carboxylesterase
VRRQQRAAVEDFLAGRWRSGCAKFGEWAFPRAPRLAGAVLWVIGPYVMGRYDDLRVLTIDADADETLDATARLGDLHTPTLVASGGRDTAYPPDVVRELVAALPNAHHIEYPKATHMGPGAVFGDDACAFLAGGD